MNEVRTICGATTRAAALLGMRDLGRIERGASADLVAVSGDPLNDVTVLRQPVMVIARGKLITR